MHRKFDCPYCGGTIDSDIKGRDFLFCSYCGQRIQLDDEKVEVTLNKNININKNTHYRYTDDAEIIKAKNTDKENKRGWIALIVCVIIAVGIPFGMLAKFDIEKEIAQKKEKCLQVFIEI